MILAIDWNVYERAKRHLSTNPLSGGRPLPSSTSKAQRRQQERGDLQSMAGLALSGRELGCLRLGKTGKPSNDLRAPEFLNLEPDGFNGRNSGIKRLEFAGLF